MITIRQSRKLISGWRTLNIRDEDNNVEAIKDVLRVITGNGDDLFLDIDKHGVISLWSNTTDLKIDKEI